MNKLRKSIRRVFFMYFIFFTCLVFTVISILRDRELALSTYNPRIIESDNNIRRGEILDYNGNVLVQTNTTEEGYVREYIYGEKFAHVIGYSSMGKTGVESRYNFELNSLRFEIVQRIKNIFFSEELKGNNVFLTLDKDIQLKAYEILGDRKGAVIVTEPSTGKILAMVSYPNYDPNTLEEDWDRLNEDTEGSPFLNRATQGLYPPGSVFKIVTAASALENITQLDSLTFECTGEKNFENKKIHCYNFTKHGTVDLIQAFAKSCNTTFAQLGVQLGYKKILEVSERLGFNKAIEFPLVYNNSTVSLTETSTESELVETSIGQGKTLVTPLEMVRIVSAIANGGLLMENYILDHTEDANGNILQKKLPEKDYRMFTLQEAEALKKMMVEVVENGTGKKAQIEGISVAGKTGTAENPSGEAHSWFVGFAPADNPKVAVSIIVENAGSPVTVPMAKELMETALKSK